MAPCRDARPERLDTSSSESVLPRMISKLTALGVERDEEAVPANAHS
jgi:hypothetical protein